MILFLLGAGALNLLALGLFYRFHRAVAAWPLPGLWWLGLLWLVIELTLWLAKVTL